MALERPATSAHRASDKPRVRHGLVSRQVDEELILYDAASDRVLLLNPSAAAVLDLCDGSRSVESIANEIASRYGVERGRARSSVDSALDEFHANGILCSSEGDDGAT